MVNIKEDLAMTYGSGDYTYKVDKDWGKLPDGYEFNQVAGVAVDKEDNVYLYNRSDHQVMVFAKNGDFVKSWDVKFSNPHGMHIGPDGNFYFADCDAHVVLKYSPDQTLLLTLGTYDVPSNTGYEGELMVVPHPAGPFNLPTGVVVSDDGSIFVSDGYGNCRFHKFSPDGALLDTWGEAGKDNPMDFHLPHGIGINKDGLLAICDRENHRIQFTDQDGEFMFIWDGFLQPTDITFGADGEAYVSELQHRISILDSEGNLISRWADESSSSAGHFIAPHGIAVDSSGDIYVGEVLEGRRIQKFIRQ